MPRASRCCRSRTLTASEARSFRLTNAPSHRSLAAPMATMLLVRHGQASWFEEDYDLSSSVGEAQSRLHGELWAELGLKVISSAAGKRSCKVHSADMRSDAYPVSV